MTAWEDYQRRLGEYPTAGWAKVGPGEKVEDVPSIHVGPIPGRKSVCLSILDQSNQYPLAYFRDEASARLFIKVINDFFLDKNGEDNAQQG